MCVVSALKPKPFSFCLCCASRSPLNTGIPSTMWIVSVCMLLVKASTTAAQKSHSTLAYPPLHIQCAHSNHASNEQAHNEWILLVPLLVRIWFHTENVCWNFVWLLAVLHVSKEPEIDTIIGTNCRWRRTNRRKHTHNLATIKWRFSTGARAQTEDEQNAHTTDQPGGWMPLCCVPDPRCTR